MAHGIFPTHNKYYLAHELFPFLSKEEKKAVYFPERKSKRPASLRHKTTDEDEESAPVQIKHK